MEILGYLVFIVIAIVIRVTKAEARKENGEIGKKLLTDLKDAFRGSDEPVAPAKTPEELMNESSWDKLTASMDEFPDPDDLFSPVGAVARLFDLDKSPDTDSDDDSDDDRGGESHYFSADETGEGHVAHVGLSREKQLEQLETWKEGGLIDEDEYKERKRKIKRG